MAVHIELQLVDQSKMQTTLRNVHNVFVDKWNTINPLFTPNFLGWLQCLWVQIWKVSGKGMFDQHYL